MNSGTSSPSSTLQTLLFTAFLSVPLVSCGDAVLTDGGIDDHTAIDSTLVSTDESITGTGSLVFTQPMGSVRSGRNFTLTLSMTDDASITLHTYSTQSLSSGVDLRLTRNGTGLSVSIDSGSGAVDISSSFTGVNPSQEFTLSWDVHNDESPTHVLAWNTDETSENSALFNSEDSGSTSGTGQGNFWGLTLQTGVTVKQAFASDTRFEE